jgi:hypothetical protein
MGRDLHHCKPRGIEPPENFTQGLCENPVLNKLAPALSRTGQFDLQLFEFLPRTGGPRNSGNPFPRHLLAVL